MHQILSFLIMNLKTDEDIFTLFCHILETIFPSVSLNQHFFDKSDSYLPMRTEFQIFSQMAEKIKPKLAKNLSAVYKVKKYSVRQTDYSAFEINLTKLAEKWYLSLFTLGLANNSICRIWDLLLIYGFEIFPRIGMTLLSCHEKLLIQEIEKEMKLIGGERCTDALIIAGNRAILSVLNSVKPISISSCIKTIITSISNPELGRSKYFVQSEKLQRFNSLRMLRLRQSRSLLETQKFTKVEYLKIACEMVSLNISKVKTGEFIQIAKKYTSLQLNTILHIYTSIDVHLTESVDYIYFFLAFALLLPLSLESRLNAFVETLPKIPLNKESFLEYLTKIEKFLDPYSSDFIENLNTSHFDIINGIQEVSLEKFSEVFINNQIFSPLVQLISALDDETINVIDLRVAEINLSGSYSNVTSSEASISENSDDESIKVIKEKLLEINLEKNHEKKNVSECSSKRSFSESSLSKGLDKEEYLKPEIVINEKIVSTKFSYEELNTPKINKDNQRNCSRLCSKPSCIVN